MKFGAPLRELPCARSDVTSCPAPIGCGPGRLQREQERPGRRRRPDASVTAGLATLLKLSRPNCRTVSSKSSLQKFNRQIRVKLKHRANNKATYLKAA